MSVVMSHRRFEELVADALDELPPEIIRAMDNIVVLIESRHPEEPTLLGLYTGIALTERDTTYAGFAPDTVEIYRDALLDWCSSEEELVEEVRVTVLHEIAHHFGLSDERLTELGWD